MGASESALDGSTCWGACGWAEISVAIRSRSLLETPTLASPLAVRAYLGRLAGFQWAALHRLFCLVAGPFSTPFSDLCACSASLERVAKLPARPCAACAASDCRSPGAQPYKVLMTSAPYSSGSGFWDEAPLPLCRSPRSLFGRHRLVESASN